MKHRKLGLWLGISCALVGIMTGLYFSTAVQGGAFAGLLVSSLCAVAGIVLSGRSQRAD
jgi:membrane protein implicated in regulation of membrane protease activity